MKAYSESSYFITNARKLLDALLDGKITRGEFEERLEYCHQNKVMSTSNFDRGTAHFKPEKAKYITMLNVAELTECPSTDIDGMSYLSRNGVVKGVIIFEDTFGQHKNAQLNFLSQFINTSSMPVLFVQTQNSLDVEKYPELYTVIPANNSKIKLVNAKTDCVLTSFQCNKKEFELDDKVCSLQFLVDSFKQFVWDNYC